MNIAVTNEIPLDHVIGEVVAAEYDRDLDVEDTDEEELGTHDKAVYDDLEDLKGVVVWMVMEVSLCDISMIGLSGSKPI